jgi:hypothetical protein
MRRLYGRSPEDIVGTVNISGLHDAAESDGQWEAHRRPSVVMRDASSLPFTPGAERYRRARGFSSYFRRCFRTGPPEEALSMAAEKLRRATITSALRISTKRVWELLGDSLARRANPGNFATPRRGRTGEGGEITADLMRKAWLRLLAGIATANGR